MIVAIEAPHPSYVFSLFHTLCTPDIFGFVLITTAMALYTMFIVVNAFLHMLLADLGAGVLVAAVAGVAAVVVVHVTGLAFRCVVPVEAEVVVVVEGCRGPALPGVARTAIALYLPVQRVAWINVATAALFLHLGLKQSM